MTKEILRSSKLQLTLLVGLVLALLVYIFITIYLFAFKATSKSYSFTQSWEEYYNLEDWNLTTHAITDIDGDGIKDMITFTNCAFLSSVKPETISTENECQEPGMSIIAFSDNSITVGQKLTSQKPFRYNWLRKSYLVKTNQNKWKFFDMNGLLLRKYELNDDHLFKEVSPTYLDKIDALTYQISHLGIILLLIMLPR